MVEVQGAPRIEGLRFRRFRDDSDYSVMASVGRRSLEADKIDFLETEEDIANEYRNLPDRDPSAEVIIAEVLGEPVGCGRVWSEPAKPGQMAFWHVAHVIPEWRRTSLRTAIFHFNEAQACSRAAHLGKPGKAFLEVWALDEPNEWRDLVLAEKYLPIMHFFDMVLDNLERVPDLPIPGNLELRPAEPRDYPKIWNAAKEAFRDKPWFIEGRYDKEHYQLWQASPTFKPDLWVVAWDGDEVAGMANNQISLEENLAFNRERGYTQNLFVLPRWQRRGLGKALLSKSIIMMRERGLKEASLVVETQSTSGELHLYESMGYRVTSKYGHYAKPLNLSCLNG